MRVLVFDTETTGLPKTKLLNPDTLHLWPHILQLSFVIYDTEENDIVQSKDYIIKVDETIIINEETTKIHGITNEISQLNGVQLEYALNEFFYYLRQSDMLVGHNVSFDINMIKIELLRIIYLNKVKATKQTIYEIKHNLHYLTNYKNIVCTLQDSIDLCNIKAVDKYGKTYAKWPRLLELHQKLFETVPNNLHNSFNDILVTLRCFIKMKMDIDLNEECNKFKNIVNQIGLF
jgi:DNA polymerase III epsilon subunit-like protein